MLFKIIILCLLASVNNANPTVMPADIHVEHSVSFETAHKQPLSITNENEFETSHKTAAHYDVDSELRSMNLLPTKERPELNPVLSALINEDVMKSIESKRAIEEAELEAVRAEADAAAKQEKEQAKKKKSAKKAKEEKQPSGHNSEGERPYSITEIPPALLTTNVPIMKSSLENDDEMVEFVDQAINFEVAGSENKKSRIEIKKGPNGQDYEYEYVYYYEEDEDDNNKSKTTPEEVKAESRGKSRYTNIERSSMATPTENSLNSGHAKGRSSNVESIEGERLPANTRFPSRSKAIDATPTPSVDSMETAAEKKKISVKRPSLELVDSDTFNTDEKQIKGARNGDTEAKSLLTLEQEMAVLVAAQAAAESNKATKTVEANSKDTKPLNEADTVEETTPTMQKAALDLYAILANENNNMEMTTTSDLDITTILPDTTDLDEGLTTIIESSTSTTTTTTTPKPTTTTTTTTTTTATTPATFYGGKRPGLGNGARNRYKPKLGGSSGTTTTTTEAPSGQGQEQPKNGRNRFSRPSLGGRNRPNGKTTAAPSHQEEEEVNVKEVKPVSNGFGRNKPRNRFNLRGTSTTTEGSANAKSNAEEDSHAATTTARSLRSRPNLNVRSRNRSPTTKAPTSETSSDNDSENTVDDKSTALTSTSSKTNRFNINRANGNRLSARGKFTKATTEAGATIDDAPVENDIKPEENDKTNTAPNANGFKSLNNRPRPGALQKSDKIKPISPIAPRKVNPLLAKKRLQLGPTSTEPALNEDAANDGEEESDKEETAETTNTESKVENVEEEEGEETTTKTQPRGLALLGQRRRLPLRKPGTSL